MTDHPLRRFVMRAEDQAMARPHPGVKVLKHVDRLVEEHVARPSSLDQLVGRLVRA